MFCRNCGIELPENARFCPKCGTQVEKHSVDSAVVVETTAEAKVQDVLTPDERNLVNRLAERIKTEALIWGAVSAIQCILGKCFLWIVLFVGVVNIIYAVREYKFSKRIKENPTGILESYKSLKGPIVVLIYNVLAGAVIGIIGSIYYLTAVREMVMENWGLFEEIERKIGITKKESA